MRSYISAFTLLLVFVSVQAQTLSLNKAETHAMQYYLSLPKGWKADRTWPILLVLESANKEFEKNAQRFIDARKDLPFIIVAPVNVNNGNMGRRDPAIFPYSATTWEEIDRVGDCKFNMDGILAIIAEVRKKYNAEPSIFATGFEAGTHALWPLVFQHPELLKVAVPVAGNYNQRTCLDQPASTDPARGRVIIKAFSGSEDEYFGPNKAGKTNQYLQYESAKKFALEHGFKNISEQVVTGKGHEPLVDEVMAYMKTLL